AAPAAEQPPLVEQAARDVAEVLPVVAPRRRFWPFGRRARLAEEPPGEWPEEEPAPQPPPWTPEIDEEEGPVAPELLPPEEAEGIPVEVEAREAEEAWEEEEPWESPVVGEPVPPAAGDWQAGEEEPPPPPWVSQSDLDRAAPIPIIPAGLPGEEPGVEPVEDEWAEEPAAYPPSGSPTEKESSAAFPAVPADEPTEEWEVFPEPGRPMGADEPPSAVEAAPGDWGEPVGIDAAGHPAGPRDLTSEEVFVGAVTSEHRDLAEEVAAADSAEAHLQALSAPMAGLESGVVGFEDVAYLGGEEEYVEKGRSDLPIRVATGMVLVGILLGAMWVGGEFLAGFVGLLAVLGLGELYGTLRRAGYQPLALFGFLGAIGLLAGTWFYGLVAIPVAAVALTAVCFFYYTLASRRRDPLTNGSLTLLGMLWVTGPIAFVFPIAVAPDFRVLVLAAAATVIATDVGAFFAGRSWGSRPLAPVLSPNKTVEGLAGGVVAGIAVAMVIGYFLEPLNLRIGAGLGLVVAVMAPLGDLAESMLKRSLGAKDMGAILPGHGGILDRIDAYLFVLPAVWVLYETLGLLR
ncbi:MAG TPA: phosphatidate cytidylyltransferase, partial [Acidimicrobiia bacterium]|nr:phosphatidate cytidylyltransferase [Acidimicrobiia bacterium]